jgi:hypothetical protein
MPTGRQRCHGQLDHLSYACSIWSCWHGRSHRSISHESMMRELPV